MNRRYAPILIVVLAFFVSTACTFSTKLSTPTPPGENLPGEVIATPEATRPQTTFIDARTLPDSAPADGESVSVAEAQTVALSGDGASADSGSYAHGGYGGYGYSGGYYGGWSGYYGWACAPRYDWAYTYVVRYGDTLTNIAWRAGTSWQELAAGNCIPYPDYIYAGQYLRVPNPVAPYPYPPHPYPPYPPHPYPPYPYPTPVPTGIPPTSVPPVPPPVVIGSALTFAPYDEINNSTVILAPDTMITISWVGTFPTAVTQVTFELIPPGGSSGTPIGSDTNPGDGVAITWFATAYVQGTIRAYASFSGGYAPQYSDSYYVIAGWPP